MIRRIQISLVVLGVFLISTGIGLFSMNSTHKIVEIPQNDFQMTEIFPAESELPADNSFEIVQPIAGNHYDQPPQYHLIFSGKTSEIVAIAYKLEVEGDPLVLPLVHDLAILSINYNILIGFIDLNDWIAITVAAGVNDIKLTFIVEYSDDAILEKAHNFSGEYLSDPTRQIIIKSPLSTQERFGITTPEFSILLQNITEIEALYYVILNSTNYVQVELNLSEIVDQQINSIIDPIFWAYCGSNDIIQMYFHIDFENGTAYNSEILSFFRDTTLPAVEILSTKEQTLEYTLTEAHPQEVYILDDNLEILLFETFSPATSFDEEFFSFHWDKFVGEKWLTLRVFDEGRNMFETQFLFSRAIHQPEISLGNLELPLIFGEIVTSLSMFISIPEVIDHEDNDAKIESVSIYYYENASTYNPTFELYGSYIGSPVSIADERYYESNPAYQKNNLLLDYKFNRNWDEIPEGSHFLEIVAKSTSGGIKVQTLNFIKDISAPIVTAALLIENDTESGLFAKLQIDANDSTTIEKIWYQYGTNAPIYLDFIPGSQQILIQKIPLEILDYESVSVYAKDSVGNVGEVVIEIEHEEERIPIFGEFYIEDIVSYGLLGGTAVGIATFLISKISASFKKIPKAEKVPKSKATKPKAANSKSFLTKNDKNQKEKSKSPKPTTSKKTIEKEGKK